MRRFSACVFDREDAGAPYPWSAFFEPRLNVGHKGGPSDIAAVLVREFPPVTGHPCLEVKLRGRYHVPLCDCPGGNRTTPRDHRCAHATSEPTGSDICIHRLKGEQLIVHDPNVQLTTSQFPPGTGHPCPEVKLGGRYRAPAYDCPRGRATRRDHRCVHGQSEQSGPGHLHPTALGRATESFNDRNAHLIACQLSAATWNPYLEVKLRGRYRVRPPDCPGGRASLCVPRCGPSTSGRDET